MRRSLIASLALAGCMASAPQPRPSEEVPQPPVAPRQPKDVTVNGDKRIDDYFWLRDKGTPEVESYGFRATTGRSWRIRPTRRVSPNTTCT